MECNRKCIGAGFTGTNGCCYATFFGEEVCGADCAGAEVCAGEGSVSLILYTRSHSCAKFLSEHRGTDTEKKVFRLRLDMRRHGRRLMLLPFVQRRCRMQRTGGVLPCEEGSRGGPPG
jgi:hypothetical protein